jgi:hypothetical protein
MAEQAIDLTKKVKLYAPKGAKFHEAGEETEVHPLQAEHFKKLGYTETAPATTEPAKPAAPAAKA